MRKKIAIDIDDVIAESTEALRLVVNEQTGKALTIEDYRVPGDYWGYYESVWRQHEIDLDFVNIRDDMSASQTHVGLVAGAEYAIHHLLERFDVVLVTSRDVSWENATRRWIESHFQDKLPEVHFAKGRGTKSELTKGQLCKELGASWLVDDNPEHCQSAIDEGIVAILFGEYGWNQGHSDGAVRCLDWPSVLEYFNEG